MRFLNALLFSGLTSLAMAAAAAPAAKGKISKDEAKAIALKLFPGKVVEVESEKLDGEAVFSVEIKAADGSKREIVVREADGSVLKNAIDDDDDDEHEREDKG